MRDYIFVEKETFSIVNSLFHNMIPLSYRYEELGSVIKIKSTNSYRFPFNTSKEKYIYFDATYRKFRIKGTEQLIRVSKFLSILLGVSEPKNIKHVTEVFIEAAGDSEDHIILINAPSIVYNLPAYISSCMAGDGEYYEWLESRVDVRVAYILSPRKKKVVARALIWHRAFDLETGLEVNVMDRIYSTSNTYKKALMSWGLRNGYMVRHGDHQIFLTRQNSSKPERKKLAIIINGVPDADDFMPYLDTFNCAYRYKGFAILSNTRHLPDIKIENIHLFHADFAGMVTYTDGRHPFAAPYECDFCGEPLMEDEVFFVSDYTICEDCLDEHFVYSSIVGNYIEIDKAQQCEICRDWNYEEDMYIIYDNLPSFTYICDDCVQKHDYATFRDIYLLSKYYFAAKDIENLRYCITHRRYYMNECLDCMRRRAYA